MCSRIEVISADFLIYSSNVLVHNKSSTGFSNVFIHRGSFCNLKVFSVRGLPLTGTKPVRETSFLRCKRYNNRGKILCQHVYFQSPGFNRGKYCSQDNLEHTRPKGSLYFCLNYDDKYQQQEKMHNQLTMPHESSNEGNSVNFLDMYQWLKQIRGQGFFMDILNASALSACFLSYTIGPLTYSTLVLSPRNNTVMKHCPNAYTAFTELVYKTMHAFRGMEREWSRTDL